MDNKKREVPSKTPSFILELPLKLEPFQIHILDKRFEIARKIYNAVVHELYRRYYLLIQSKEYQRIKKQIKATYRLEEKLRHLNLTIPSTLEEERKYLWKIINTLRQKAGLTEKDIHSFVKTMYTHFKKNLDSHSVQKIASHAWNAMEKFLYGNGKKLHFKKFGQLQSVEGKWNKSGIRYRDQIILWNGLTLPVQVKKSDNYAHQALKQLIKFCRILRKIIRGKIRYFVQLVLEGFPPQKKDQRGEPRHPINEGPVGIDIGVSTIAIVSEKQVKLLELAPHVKLMEKEKRKLQRKMDRQKRANNPHKYKEDGTVKKGNREKWNRSRNYLKVLFQYKEICRKQKEIRKQDHEKMANWILTCGNDIRVEKMNFKGLQRKAKETKKDEKTGRFKKKKRFGKSIANRAPSQMLSILARKLSLIGLPLKEVNTSKVKASQYNHFTDTYEKKELKERWNIFNIDHSPIRIQRDLYSGFLIMNTKRDLEKVDRERCFQTFSNFHILHEKEIARLIQEQTKHLQSIGL
ncbi:MAG TPA: transposase [Paenibacillaceae bacterium]|nr:transposase [Paenibacillaceae bacterium]